MPVISFAAQRMAVLAAALLLPASAARAAAPTAVEGKPMVLADYAREGELRQWQLENSGPLSTVAAAPGPEGTTAAEVTCVYEPQLAPQTHSPAPYMAFRRAFDGEAVARAGYTRLTLWHKGDGVQVVFNEKEHGASYYTQVPASTSWQRVSCPFAEFTFGWSDGGRTTGRFDVSRIETLHFGAAPARQTQISYCIAEIVLERVVDDLDPTAFVGSATPTRLDLYPRALGVPVNRTQPLLVVVANEMRCGLKERAVELSLEGSGALSPLEDRAGESASRKLRLTTDADGKARARWHPGQHPGERATVTARLAGAEELTARAELASAPRFERVHLAANGFFARPDGEQTILLGGLFLPWWSKIENGVARRGERISIIGASEADQRAWFAYLRDNGVNHIRGYWPVGAPLHLGPGGAEIVHSFFIDGQVNEPVVAALERTMAIGGEYGIGFTLTIADIARPLIAPQGRIPPGKTRREVAHESMDFLREFVPRLRFNPNVWAFELTNEQNWSIFEWSERFVRTIKELDDETPVMISHWGGALQTADPQAWMRLTSIDIYQPHHYPDRGHSLWGPEVDSGLLQEVHYNGMAGPKPWMLGESGGYGTHPPLGPAPDAETQRYLARDCIWFALLNRSLGASIWGILHDANTQFKVAAEVAPLVDWAALARAEGAGGRSRAARHDRGPLLPEPRGQRRLEEHGRLRSLGAPAWPGDRLPAGRRRVR